MMAIIETVATMAANGEPVGLFIMGMAFLASVGMNIIAYNAWVDIYRKWKDR